MLKKLILASAIYSIALSTQPSYQKLLIAAGTTACSFFATRFLKEQIRENILTKYIPYFKSTESTPYTIKYMVTGGMAHLATMAVKIIIWQKLYKHPVDGTGATHGPAWLDKAWLLGDACALIEEGLEELWSLHTM